MGITPDRVGPDGPRGGAVTRGALVRLGLAVLAVPLAAQERVVPRVGLVITHSVRLTPGTWHLTPDP